MTDETMYNANVVITLYCVVIMEYVFVENLEIVVRPGLQSVFIISIEGSS